jgi:hypothetical protein
MNLGDMLLSCCGLDGGDDLTNDAQLGERAKGRKLVASEISDGFKKTIMPSCTISSRSAPIRKYVWALDFTKFLYLQEYIRVLPYRLFGKGNSFLVA